MSEMGASTDPAIGPARANSWNAPVPRAVIVQLGRLESACCRTRRQQMPRDLFENAEARLERRNSRRSFNT